MIFLDSITCDGVIIDHLIDMTYQYTGRFHRLNLKKHELSCSDGDHMFSPSYNKIDFEIGI